MTRAPYEFYAKALLTTRTPAAVAEILVSQGFEGPDLPYLRSLKKALMDDRPTPYIPGRRADDDWLRRHRIHGFVRRGADAMAARAFFSEVRFRTALEMMLIGGVTADETAEALSTLSGSHVDVAVVETYRHYFWNRDIMSRDDWKSMLVSSADGSTTDRYHQGRTLLSLMLSDPQVALWKVGARPDLETSAVLDTVIQDSFMRWLETKQETNNTYTAVKMERIGNILLKALQAKSDQGGAAAAVNRQRHRLALAVTENKRVDGRKLLEQEGSAEEILELNNVRVLPGKKEK